MEAKICGVKDKKILNFIVSHKYAPKFIGFICNYPKSHRNLSLEKLKTLLDVKKHKSNFVAVLVSPNLNYLKKLARFNFDFFQLYNVSPKKTLIIKKKFKKKIISVIQVSKMNDVNNYKKYINIADIILFDSKGYEKSLGFNHSFLSNVPKIIKTMIAGNVKYNQNLANFEKISDIIDISGSLETRKKKDVKKINIFLKNINKVNKKNEN
tara:strand:+ start:695 stop:1324 length:630 start_codon:yes stop_codon:yes gene_type:complete